MQFILGLILTSFTSAVFAYDCAPGTCMSFQTCCPTDIPDDYNCCPHRDGVCCSDRATCCPKNTVCDLIRGTCDKLEVNLQELDKRQGVPAEERPFFQNLCDDWSFCPYGSTCCMTLDGTYACCPYIQATCCRDKIHCCPHDEECDATSEYCIGRNMNSPSKTKEPSFAINEESLI